MIQRTTQSIALTLWDIKSLTFSCLSSVAALDHISWRQPLPMWPHSYKRRGRSTFAYPATCQDGMDLLVWAILMLKESRHHILSWDACLSHLEQPPTLWPSYKVKRGPHFWAPTGLMTSDLSFQPTGNSTWVMIFHFLKFHFPDMWNDYTSPCQSHGG